MSLKRTTKVEVPGADPEVTSQPEAAAVSEVAAAESAAAAPNPLLPQVELQTATLADSANADQAKALELNRQVSVLNSARTGDGPALPGGAALDWSHLTNPAAIMAKLGIDPEAHLPQPGDVDWKTVQGDRVLTKQGWLLRP